MITVDFSETIAASDLKGSRSRHLIEYIVNNHPLTKNKPIYHARISKQGNGEGSPSHFTCLRSERDKLVYFWSMGSYLLYNATTAEENHQKTNLIYSQL